MLSYETLDTIADAYIPLLALVCLALLVGALFKSQWRLTGLRFLVICALLSIAYGLMWFDSQFKLWPLFGLDYSTHTAVALVLVVFLAANMTRLAAFWVGSLVLYALLMLYQGYHTVSDIVVTAFVVFIPAWLIVARLSNQWPFATAKTLINHT